MDDQKMTGNLRSTVLKSVGISLASVVEGATHSLSFHGQNIMTNRHAFSIRVGFFRIALIELWG